MDSFVGRKHMLVYLRTWAKFKAKIVWTILSHGAQRDEELPCQSSL